MTVFLSLLLSILVVLPVWAVLSLGSGAQIHELLAEPGIQKALGISVRMSFVTAFMSCALGLWSGWLFARRQWAGKALSRFGLCMPYLVPNFIWAMAYTLTWNPETGFFNRILSVIGIPPLNCYGFWGMTIVMVLTHFPVAFLIIEERFLGFDASLEEAARVAGCGPFQTFLKVVMPRLWGPLLSSFILIFTLSLSAFGIPAWLGMPARQYVLTTKLYERLQTGGAEGLGEAAALGSILALVGLSLLLVELLLRRYTEVRGIAAKSPRKVLVELSAVRGVMIQGFLMSLFFISWVGPFFAVLLVTVLPTGFLSDPSLSALNGFNLKRYIYVLTELKDTREAMTGSFVWGGVAVAVILGMCAIFILAARRSTRAKVISESAMNIPLASAGAVIALGLIIGCGGKWGFVLTNTPWIVVFAFIIKHCAICYRPLLLATSQVSNEYLEAARVSGCTRAGAFRKIALPLLLPSILAAGLLAYIPVLGELSMSVFLVGPNMKTIGSVLYDLHDYADQASALALAVVLVFAIVGMNLIIKSVSRGRLGF